MQYFIKFLKSSADKSPRGNASRGFGVIRYEKRFRASLRILVTRLGTNESLRFETVDIAEHGLLVGSKDVLNLQPNALLDIIIDPYAEVLAHPFLTSGRIQEFLGLVQSIILCCRCSLSHALDNISPHIRHLKLQRLLKRQSHETGFMVVYPVSSVVSTT